MKNVWKIEELEEFFVLSPAEITLIGNRRGSNRLVFEILLKFFQHEARFPIQPREVPDSILNFIAKQVAADPNEFEKFNWENRSMTYNRADIRRYLGFRETTVKDGEDLAIWLSDKVLAHYFRKEQLKEMAYQRLKEMKIEPPTPERLNRIIRSGIHLFEESFYRNTMNKMLPETLKKLDQFLITEDQLATLAEEAQDA